MNETRSAGHRTSGGADQINRLDVEWLAIKAGVKPANRVTVPPDRVDELVRRAEREGWVAVVGPQVAFPGRSTSIIVYIAPDEAHARALAEAEAPLLPPANATLPIDRAAVLHARFGQLLGFPPCCVDEFVIRLRRGVTRRLDGRSAHEDFVAAESAVRQSSRFLGRLNDLSSDRRARIVTFYPCRYDCPQAAEYAEAVFAAAEHAAPAAASALRTALTGSVSITVDGTRGAANRLSGELLTVEFGEF